jgi:hypothetical protein
MGYTDKYKPGDEQTVYFWFYEVPGKKKMQRTRWRMNPEFAAQYFAGQKHERCEFGKITFITGSISSQGNFHQDTQAATQGQNIQPDKD